MFEKRKLLLKIVFDKAKKELNKSSKTAVSEYLNSLFDEKFGFSKHERTFVRYYTSLVENNTDYEIDQITLDHLSRYMDYKNFEDFCENYKIVKEDGATNIELKIGNDEDSLSEKLSKIIINITNTPVFNVPQLAKNGMGIGALVLILVAGFAYGSGGISQTNENKYMYWKGDNYVGTDSAYINPGIDVIAMNKEIFLHQKRITRPDTLTVENAMGKVWYDKSDNYVEFFTSPGIHPENGKALKDVTERILNNYAGPEEE